MSRRRWVSGTVAALVLASAGCTACETKCYERAVEHAPECTLPHAARAQVYVYMIHGLTPPTDTGLEALRLKLSEFGFAKTAEAEFAAAPLAALEIKRTRKCEPDARFVLLGYDVGGVAAAALARDLSAKGVPIDALVLLDPVACGAAGGVRTLLVTSGSASPAVPAAEHVAVPDAGHFTLPAHPATVAAITALLTDVAERNYRDPGDPIPYWSYKYAPEMRYVPRGNTAPEWNFLGDTTETPPALAPPAAAPTMRSPYLKTPAPAPSTPASPLGPPTPLAPTAPTVPAPPAAASTGRGVGNW
jgi:hypothetical protein